jgi:hypothetical protein
MRELTEFETNFVTGAGDKPPKPKENENEKERRKRAKKLQEWWRDEGGVPDMVCVSMDGIVQCAQAPS